MTAAAIIQAAPADICRPWLRHLLDAPAWQALCGALASDPLRLLGMWADTGHVHALFLDQRTAAVMIASTQIQDGRYPALSPPRRAAAWYERMIQDLWGHQAEGGTDPRAWLDHGHWPLSQPLSLRPGPPPAQAEPPEFVVADDDTRMRAPIGPVAGLIEEAAHLRLTMAGRRAVVAEARLGYAHRGTLALMRGKSPRTAARFAARLSGDTTVAHALAFARATESALDVAVPDRVAGLRTVMVEAERIALHLGSLETIAALAGQDRLRALCGLGREHLARVAEIGFGHRLMMDVVVPGGLSHDIGPDGLEALLAALDAIDADLPAMRGILAGSVLAERLAGLGCTAGGVVAAYAVGGVIGRAAGSGMDARVFDPVYADLGQAACLEQGGDAAARCRVRLAEMAESIRLIRTLARIMPDGPVSVALPATSGEGLGCAESGRGDVWHWIRLDHGQIAAVFPRDPGWAAWPVAEAALAGAAFEDVALIRASLGLSSAGMDL